MNYKYKTTLEKIREVLLQYESSLETMCDLANCLFTQIVPHIEIIAGEVHTFKRINHVWAYDTKEKYYVDITSEQFGFTPCFCSQDISEFEKKGYTISNNFHVWNGAFRQCEKLSCGPVLIHKAKEINMDQLFAEITKKKRSKRWYFFSKTRRKR